jgi:hypothetical protein
MKLTKDQTQKLVLGVMMLGIVIYGYNEFLLNPLQIDKKAAIQEAADLDPKIKEAEDQIKRVEAMKAKAPEARQTMEQVNAMIPEGSPVAWFQPRVAEFFKGQGIERVVSKMNADIVDKDVPGFRRVSWGLELPRLEFLTFARAISALENQEPLFEIDAFDVEAGREDVSVQRASLTLTNLVRL